MKKLAILFFFLISIILTNAQQTFLNYGKIEFEKKLNNYKEMEGDSWLENMKDKLPQFATTYFNLYFKDGKTLYEKGKDSDTKVSFFGNDGSDEDIIYTDLKQQTFVKKQSVFEETYLLSDSIRKVEWKITNDTRDIAGFECHKAIGKILDSVYIIAFYTDQIITSGGPLSYCNLPGMILGVAIPRCNLTIFATKVEWVEPNPEKILPPPAKGKMKKIDYSGLMTTLQKSMKDWGSYGRKRVINFML
ncbi:MAG: GLPGLI family protein [Bacteroidetes bacterium]|nr:GLPGLI family protein [Bacteroidota bacterium]MBS1650141.1 GLPGLI family protein [Bacteroidota bacterium]